MGWIATTQEFLTAIGFAHISLVSVVLVIFCPISFVYASGRGLNILKTKLSKNILALSLVVILSVSEVLAIIPLQVQSILFLISIGTFIYIVIWQKFYGRADKILDKKLGEDEEENGNGFATKKKKK